MKKINGFKILSYLILAMSVSLIISCSKDDETKPDPKPFLTTGSWEIADYEVSGTTEEQVIVGFLAAFTDPVYTFTNDGDYVSEDAIFGEESEGTWSVSNDNKYLTLEQGDEEIKYEILTVSSTQMKWRITYTKEELEYTKDLICDFTLEPLEE